MSEVHAFVGPDVHKATISVSIANAGRRGDVRFLGIFQSTPISVGKLAPGIVKQHGAVEFVYEAGSCHFNVERQLTVLG
jgi:transposase